MKKKLHRLLFVIPLLVSTINAISAELFPKDIVEKINKLLVKQTVIGASRLNTNIEIIYPKYDLLKITPIIIAGPQDSIVKKVSVMDAHGKVIIKDSPNSPFVILKVNLRPGCYSIHIEAEEILPNKTIKIKIPNSTLFCINKMDDNIQTLVQKIKEIKDCRERLKAAAMLYEYLTKESGGINDYSYGRDLAIFLLKRINKGGFKCSDLDWDKLP